LGKEFHRITFKGWQFISNGGYRWKRAKEIISVAFQLITTLADCGRCDCCWLLLLCPDEPIPVISKINNNIPKMITDIPKNRKIPQPI